MKATDFEYRHQTLLHLLLGGLAVSTYFLNPDDIVWASVRRHSNSAFLEQVAFGAGTLVLLSCALLETWASAYTLSGIPLTCDGPYRYLRYPLLLARLLFSLVLGLLVPLPGTIAIVGGEALLIFRLLLRDRAHQPRAQVRGGTARWGEAFRWVAAKWGFAATMIVFTLTLKDRIAEIGGGVSFLLWLALNYPRLLRSHDFDRFPTRSR